MRNVIVISAIASIALLLLYIGTQKNNKMEYEELIVRTTTTTTMSLDEQQAELEALMTTSRPKSITVNTENGNKSENDMKQRLQKVKHELRVLNSILPDQKALYGHIFNNENMEQVSYYSNVASQPWIRTICEIGFAAGHSTVIYMESNPNVKVYSFDDYGRPHIVDLVRRYIGAKYPERHMIIRGDSTVTVPEFARRNPNVKCDLISIDGAHHASYPWNDIVNMKQLASPRNVVLADDYLQKKDFPTPDTKNFKDVVTAWDQAVQKGMIREIETRASKSTFRGYGKGWAYGSYV